MSQSRDRIYRKTSDEYIYAAATAHSQDFKKFMKLLSFEQHKTIRSDPSRAIHTNVAAKLLSSQDVAAWLASKQSASNILQLDIGKKFDPERIFESLAVTLRESEAHAHPTVLMICPSTSRDSESEITAVASLIEQFLRQQPRLYPRIQPFFSRVYDAVSGKDMKWKQRIFWRCLESLLYSPKDSDTFFFVHIGNSANRAKTARSVTVAAAKTETPLRVVVSVEDKLDYWHDPSSGDCLYVNPYLGKLPCLYCLYYIAVLFELILPLN